MSECDREAAGQLLILHEDKVHRFSNFTRVHFWFLFFFARSYLVSQVKISELTVGLQLRK